MKDIFKIIIIALNVLVIGTTTDDIVKLLGGIGIIFLALSLAFE